MANADPFIMWSRHVSGDWRLLRPAEYERLVAEMTRSVAQRRSSIPAAGPHGWWLWVQHAGECSQQRGLPARTRGHRNAGHVVSACHPGSHTRQVQPLPR